MSKLRDGYSEFGFYNAIPADVYAAAVNGATIDLRNYDTCTFVVNAQSLDSTGANSIADIWKLVVQHGLASATGVSTWSLVPASLLIHSVAGGYDSTAETGQYQYLVGSVTSTGYAVSTAVYTVGYKGDMDHRYVRICFSVSGSPSTMWAAAVAVTHGQWSVNTPVN